MSEKTPTRDRQADALQRKKNALRDNLKRRKAQVRELKSPDEKQLRLRDREMKPKSHDT